MRCITTKENAASLQFLGHERVASIPGRSRNDIYVKIGAERRLKHRLRLCVGDLFRLFVRRSCVWNVNSSRPFTLGMKARRSWLTAQYIQARG
jgi:hypothetical protein